MAFLGFWSGFGAANAPPPLVACYRATAPFPGLIYTLYFFIVTLHFFQTFLQKRVATFAPPSGMSNWMINHYRLNSNVVVDCLIKYQVFYVILVSVKVWTGEREVPAASGLRLIYKHVLKSRSCGARYWKLNIVVQPIYLCGSAVLTSNANYQK